MVTHLFSDFLNNLDEYQSAESFWKDLCSKELRLHSPVSDWQAWLTKQFSDGTAFSDGNPIFDIVSPSTQIGIRIIQHEPTSNEIRITAWTATFGGEPGDEETVSELVIDCELSSESAEIAKRLIREWVEYDELLHGFESIIQRILR